MQKLFLFAAAIAAMTLAFTACNQNGPSNPDEIKTDVNPADYLNTMWRIDSVFMDGAKSRPPHGLIRVLDSKKAVFNGDTAAYEFKDGQLIFGGTALKIAGVKKGWAHLQIRGGDLYLSQLPELDMNNMIMEPKAADFVGTWKHAYYVMDNHTPGEPVWYNEGSNPWVETWEFKADGTCIYKDWLSGETETGTWNYEYGLQFLNNPLEDLLIDDKDRITVQPLTKNWFQILRSQDGYSYYYWWFYRVQ